MKTVFQSKNSKEKSIFETTDTDVQIWTHSIFQKMFRDFAPELLAYQPKRKDKRLLNAIQQYLFQEEELDSELLEQTLIPEFYGALYGLKTLLQKHSLEEAALILKHNEQGFLNWANKRFGG